MFAKSLKDIEFRDVYDLVFVHKQDEGYHLDYKGEPQKTDHFADKMVKSFLLLQIQMVGMLFWELKKSIGKKKYLKSKDSLKNLKVRAWLNGSIKK